MKLSIIVPALDEAAGIGTVLQGLAPLRQQGHEVIVVDGGSSDGTPALAAPLADRVLGAPRGRARQMNAGAAVARGDALVFLHADTRLPRGAAALNPVGMVARSGVASIIAGKMVSEKGRRLASEALSRSRRDSHRR